jgi:hypothetical protein
MLSTPAAMPASIWPSAILLATRIAASRLVPQVEARRLRIEPRRQYAFARQVEVAGMLDDRAGDHVAEALALKPETSDEAPQCRREQVLVAVARVGAVGAGKGNARAAEDRDASDLGSDKHGRSP